MSAPAGRAPANRSLEWLKWFGLAAMSIGHTIAHPVMDLAEMDRFVEVYGLAIVFGAPALPIFCSLIVWRIAHASAKVLPGYLKRLGAWGLLSQPIYFLWVPGLGMWAPNALATLCFGALGCALLVQRRWPWLLVLLGTLFALSESIGRDWSLVLVMVFGLLLVQRAGLNWPGLLALLTTFATARMALPYDALSFQWSMSLITVPLLWWLATRLPAQPGRLPGWMFYAWYPFHLGLIVLAWRLFALS
ncbi:MAG: TraX family protein [Rhodocyclaceae bacterium]|nr:TraX family protein [Rhodocyclaceae bacterium]